MHGQLSAGLAPLATNGRHIVSTTTGEAVRLCGVNRSGLEYVEPRAPSASSASVASVTSITSADPGAPGSPSTTGEAGVADAAGVAAVARVADAAGMADVAGMAGDVGAAGVVSSSDGSAFLDGAGIAEDEIATIARLWGARILRLPFNQEFVLRGRRTQSGAAYLDALDRVIAWAAAHGCYTLLDLQWLDADRVFGMNADFSFNRVAPLPDAGSVEVWRILAARYRDEPAVLFDLFNEPHDPLPDDDHPLIGACADGTLATLPGRRVRMREWQPWARLLIATIRDVHPSALIFVSGVRWAYDLRGMPLVDPAGAPLPNIVYSTHVYASSRTALLRFGSLEQDWDRAFGRLSEHVPVFVGEWGGTDEHLDWGARLRRYLDAREIGWTAWSWADWPCLVASCRTRDYSATAFGALVFDALQNRA